MTCAKKTDYIFYWNQPCAQDTNRRKVLSNNVIFIQITSLMIKILVENVVCAWTYDRKYISLCYASFLRIFLTLYIIKNEPDELGNFYIAYVKFVLPIK